MGAVEKKGNFFVKAGKRVSKFFREIKSELKKVVWPTRSQIIKSTIVVLITIVIVGAFVWVFDAVAGVLVQGLISLIR